VSVACYHHSTPACLLHLHPSRLATYLHAVFRHKISTHHACKFAVLLALRSTCTSSPCHCLCCLASTNIARFSVSPFLSPRTLAPTAPSAMPLSTCRPPLRPTVPSRSFPARRSWSARSLSSSLASLSPLERRSPRVPTVRVLARRVLAAALLAVAVVVAVAATDVAVPVVVPSVTRRRRVTLSRLLPMPPPPPLPTLRPSRPPLRCFL
jgi:hypothetical protein